MEENKIAYSSTEPLIYQKKNIYIYNYVEV